MNKMKWLNEWVSTYNMSEWMNKRVNGWVNEYVLYLLGDLPGGRTENGGGLDDSRHAITGTLTGLQTSGWTQSNGGGGDDDDNDDDNEDDDEEKNEGRGIRDNACYIHQPRSFYKFKITKCNPHYVRDNVQLAGHSVIEVLCNP